MKLEHLVCKNLNICEPDMIYKSWTEMDWNMVFYAKIKTSLY